MRNKGIKEGDERRLKRGGRKRCVKRAKHTSYEFSETKIIKQLLTKYGYVRTFSKTIKFALTATQHKTTYKFDTGSHARINPKIGKAGKSTLAQCTLTYRGQLSATQSFRIRYNIDAGPHKIKKGTHKYTLLAHDPLPRSKIRTNTVYLTYKNKESGPLCPSGYVSTATEFDIPLQWLC